MFGGNSMFCGPETVDVSRGELEVLEPIKRDDWFSSPAAISFSIQNSRSIFTVCVLNPK